MTTTVEFTADQADVVATVVAEQAAKVAGWMKVVAPGGPTYRAYAEKLAALQAALAAMTAAPAPAFA